MNVVSELSGSTGHRLVTTQPRLHGSDPLLVHNSHAVHDGLCTKCGSNDPSMLKKLCQERMTSPYDS